MRLPDAPDLGLTQANPDRPIASYQGGIAQTGAEQVGEAVSQLGQAGYKAATDALNAQDQVARASADQDFLNKKLELDEQFARDPDYQTAPQRYQAALQGALNDSASGIRNVQLRTDFMMQNGRLMNFAVGQVRGDAYRKENDADFAWVNDSYAKGINDYLAARDDPTRQAIIQNFDGILTSMAAKGSITRTHADALALKFTGDAVTAQANALIETDPQGGMRAFALNAPPAAQGLTPHLDAAVSRAAGDSNRTTGGDADTLARIAQVESAGNPEAVNPRTGAAGPFQFTPATARQYGVSDPHDPIQAASGAARLLADNRTALTAATGSPPSPSDLYLAHQQGASGAAALLTNPDQNAIDALTPVYGSRAKAEAAILDNGGTAGMKAADFVFTQAAKFNQAPGIPQTPAATPATTGVGASAPEPGTTTSLADRFPPTGDWRDHIPLVARAQLYLKAQEHANADLAHSVATQRFLDEQAEKQLRDAQVTNESALIADAASGKPIDSGKLADALRQRQITPAAFDAINAELTRQGRGSNDYATLLDLQHRADQGEDIAADTYAAIDAGKLRGATGAQLIHQADARSSSQTDAVERGAFATLRTIAGGDAVEKGMIDFGNQAQAAQAQRWAQAQLEWNDRVFVKHQDPMAVLQDMMPRYSHPIADIRALPRPRLGDIATPADVPQVWQRTKDALASGQIDQTTYDAEAGLILNYKRILDDQAARAAAAARTGPNKPGPRPSALTTGDQ